MRRVGPRKSDRAALEEIDRVVLEENDQVIWEENDKAGFNESDKAALEEMRVEREPSRARTAPARHKNNMSDCMARENDLRTGLIRKGDETGIYTLQKLSDAMRMAIGPSHVCQIIAATHGNIGQMIAMTHGNRGQRETGGTTGRLYTRPALAM